MVEIAQAPAGRQLAAGLRRRAPTPAASNACWSDGGDARGLRRGGHRRRTGGQHGGYLAGAARPQGHRAGKGAPSALSHRRIAAADESADVRAPRGARQGARARRLPSRRGLRGGQRARLQHLRVSPAPSATVRRTPIRFSARTSTRCSTSTRATAAPMRARAQQVLQVEQSSPRAFALEVQRRRRPPLQHRGALRRGRQRARCIFRGKKTPAPQEPPTPERRDIQSFPRRRDPAGRGRGQHQHLPLRSWLDVDDPAAGGHDEHRRGVPAGVSEAAGREIPRNSCWRRCNQNPDLKRRMRQRRTGGRGARHRQLFVRLDANGRPRLDPGRRCVRVPRSGVLIRCVPGDERCGTGGGGGR